MISSVENIDCMIGMQKHPDKFFDIAICDVQYGIGVGKMAFLQATNKPATQKNGAKLFVKKTKYSNKDWDASPPTQEYFDELKRVSHHQIIFGVDYAKWNGVGTGRIRWDKLVAPGVSFNRYEVAYCSLFDYEMTIPLLWAGFCQAKSISDQRFNRGIRH